MAIDWLERARNKISKTPIQTTVVAVDRILNALNTAPHQRDIEKSVRSDPPTRSKSSASSACFPKFKNDASISQKKLGEALSLLRIDDDVWVEFEERAGFLEFCEGLTREEAERLTCLELGIASESTAKGGI